MSSRINEICNKGFAALDLFYKHYGEWDGVKKRKRRRKKKRDNNSIRGPVMCGKKRGRKPGKKHRKNRRRHYRKHIVRKNKRTYRKRKHNIKK